jgi:2',3'-cyclic-nucleotide 2'-phosphodiesterase (5'-nucleotidase family)
MKKLVVAVAALCLLVSCISEEKNTVNFTFLQLNDVYEIAPLEGGKVGGMARVERLHKDLLQENPNTFMVLAGDFLYPSLLGTLKFKDEPIKGKQMVEVMNAMNFDLVAFGNHEFDLKEHELQKRLDESTFPWIGTNLYHKTDEGNQKFTMLRNGDKIEIPKTVSLKAKNEFGKEVSIGIFSACLNSNPKAYVFYEDFYEAAKNAYNVLKDKNNIVLGLTHLTIEQDKLVSKMLPEVPLIMGGHEHVNMSVAVGNAKITKADANAKTVYVHRFSHNLKTKETTINSELVPITPEIEDDDKVKGIVEKWNVLLDTKIKEILPNPNEVIFTANEPLDGRDTPIRSTQTNLGLLVTTAMASCFDAIDCAIVNGGSIRIDDQLQGDITGLDIFRVLPYGGEVLKVKMRGSLLKKVLNEGRLRKGKGAYLQRYNSLYHQETKTWSVAGNEVENEKIYNVALNDYLLKGLDISFLTHKNKGIISIHKNKETDIAFDIRKAIINYLQNSK